MGQVYRARDRKLGRDVALKVLPEEFGRDAARVSRFEREARLLASVNHPGIAAIYGAEEAGETRYLVLELVAGETLSDRMRRALSLADTLRIMRQIAEALEAAHERGIIHRDLKPANVMVTPEGRVKLLDLGLAKLMASPRTDGDGQSRELTAPLEDTRPGVIMGTVEFMSPEQARGKAIDKRTDIWAFGCILYECLSGRRAFSGDSVSDALASILLREPEWSALPADTPPPIRELLQRCLQKDAGQRLRDIGDARLAIDELLAGMDPRRSTMSGVFPAAPKRRLPRTAAIAAAAAVAVSIAAVLWWRSPRGASGQTKSVAVLPFKDLSGAPGGQLIGDGLAETVSARLANLPGIQVMTPASAVKVSDGESDPSRVASRLGAGYLLRGSIQRSGSRIRITYSVWSAREGAQVAGDALDGSEADLFGMQDRLAESVGTSLAVRRAKLATNSSGLETAEEQDEYLQAIGCLQRYDRPGSNDRAIVLLEGLAGRVPSSALVQAALARAYIHKFDQTRNADFVAKAATSVDRAKRLDPDSPEVDVTAGVLQTRKGNPRDAVPAFERALAREPSNFEALAGLAEALEASDRLPDAERAYRRAIELWPSYWAGYSNLAAFEFGRGRYREAADNYRRVTELVPDNPRAFGNLGGVELLVGDFEKAIDSFQKSLALARTGTAYANLGTAEFFLGQYAKAAEALGSAAKLTPDHYQIWSNLGDARRWAPGMRATALDAYLRAIELCRKELEVNPKNATAQSTLALCLAKSGHPEEAARHASESLFLDGKNPEILYNAAIVSNLVGRSGEAVDRIRHALEAGYPKVFVEREPELADLRSAGKLSF
jgi:tetratricopeptide (TPR) repeat protein/TolB-like protein